MHDERIEAVLAQHPSHPRIQQTKQCAAPFAGIEVLEEDVTIAFEQRGVPLYRSAESRVLVLPYTILRAKQHREIDLGAASQCAKERGLILNRVRREKREPKGPAHDAFRLAKQRRTASRSRAGPKAPSVAERR